MRHIRLRNLLAVLTSSVALAAPGFVAPQPLTVGSNLEMFTGIRLAQPAPEGGLEVTVSSDDPSRLLLARTPIDAGSKSIVLRVNAQYIETPDFYVQALGDKGEVSYTASAPGLASISGKVTLAPSAIFISGPFKAPALKTTPSMMPKIALFCGILDQSGKLVVQQPASRDISVKIASSDAGVGSVTPSELIINAGEVSAAATFKAVGLGKTTLTAMAPPGFTSPAELNAVTVDVNPPGIGLTGEIFLGKDLEVTGAILLGEPAPHGGLDVKLTSSDPKALILSAKEDQVGTGTITVHIPEGDMRASYYLQGLTSSGTVEHTAIAPGYRTRVAPVYLAPSGFMVVYGPYGPPDEAEYLRTVLVHDPRPFTVSLSDSKPVHVALWSVYLDAKTLRGADITAQRLRPGAKATLELKNSNPEVARLGSSLVTIVGPAASAASEFHPLSPGQTVISINSPQGFTAPSNATSVTATVKE